MKIVARLCLVFLVFLTKVSKGQSTFYSASGLSDLNEIPEMKGLSVYGNFGPRLLLFNSLSLNKKEGGNSFTTSIFLPLEFTWFFERDIVKKVAENSSKAYFDYENPIKRRNDIFVSLAHNINANTTFLVTGLELNKKEPGRHVLPISATGLIQHNWDTQSLSYGLGLFFGVQQAGSNTNKELGSLNLLYLTDFSNFENDLFIISLVVPFNLFEWEGVLPKIKRR